MALVLMDQWMRALDAQHAAMGDNEREPVVGSFDEITVEREWNRLLVHGSQPSPRCKHAAVAVGNKMFLAGGVSCQRTLNDVEMFHAEKLTWEILPCEPNLKLTKGEQRDTHCSSCTGHSLVFWDKQFVLVGCQTGPASKTVTVSSLDMRSRSWSTLSPKGNAPCARSGHTVVLMASTLVLFGGEDMKGKTLNDIHVLDLKNLLWLPLETSGTKPSPRRDHSAASYSGRYLWIFGGKSYKTYFNDTYCLDFLKMEWSKGRTRSPSPMARAGHSGAIAGNRWYIVGGESRGNEISNTLAFNLESQEWTEVTTNIRSGSPLAHHGISLVKIQNKGKTFLVAFGGHDVTLSDRMYVLLLPSTKQLGPFMADTPSPRSASFNSVHSVPPIARDMLSPEARISNASSGGGDSNDSTFSLNLREIDYRPEPNVDYFGDQEANSARDQEITLANQDPSTPTPNDEAPYPTHERSYDEGHGFAEQIFVAQVGQKVPSPVSADLNIRGSDDVRSTSRDLDPDTQNGKHEAQSSGVYERLLAVLKDNENLQNKLVQAKVELEHALKEREAFEQQVVLELDQILKEKDGLEQKVYELVEAKADAGYQLEQSRQKLEEIERSFSSSSRLPGDSDSSSPSTSRELINVKPNSLRMKLFDESLYDNTEESYETERRLEEAERKLSSLAILTESRLTAANREKRVLSEETATAKEMMEKARTDCKILRDENLRLEHDLLAMKAQLRETQEELQAKNLQLARASDRNSELQAEMDALSQKFLGS